MFFPSGAKFLGKTTPLAAQASSTPVLVFGPGYEWLLIYHYIAGYSSSGGIARLQFGTATTVDTGTNYSWVAQNATSSATATAYSTNVSAGGIGVGKTAVTSGRRGQHMVWNPTTDPKFIDSRTITFGGTAPVSAASTHTSIDQTMGNWWQNSEAQCAAMDAGGTVQLLSGSYISVYGVPR